MIRILPPEDREPLLRAASTVEHLRLDRLHQRQRGGCADAGGGRNRRRRAVAEGADALRRRQRHRRAAGALRHQGGPGAQRVPGRGAGRARWPRRDRSTRSACCCRAPTSAARSWPTAARAAARVVTEVVAYRNVLDEMQPRAGRTSTGCCSTASSTSSRSPAPRRSATSPRSTAPSRPRTCCRSTVVAAIGPVTAEAAARLGIPVHVQPTTYTVPALVDAIVRHVAGAKTAAAVEPGMSIMASTAVTPALSQPPAAAATHRGDPGAGARDAADAGLSHLSRCSCARATASGGQSARCRASSSCRWTRPCRRRRPRRQLGIAGVLLFGLPEHKDAIGSKSSDPRRAGAGRRAGDQARRAGPAGADRRVPVRIHLARPLRHPGRRAHGQRPDRGAAGRDGRCRTRTPAPTSWRRPT